MQVRLLILDFVLDNPLVIQNDKFVSQKIQCNNKNGKTNNQLGQHCFT